VHSHQGAVPDGTEQFHARLAGHTGIKWIDGEQLDFYDQPAQVDTAISTVLNHFHDTL